MTKGRMIKKKSKRLTCHKKYKIQKKVREHNRKERKEAKKSGNSKFKQAKKDPGVPNCPFKEEVLQEAERRKKAAEEMKEKQKRKRLEELMKRRKIDVGGGGEKKTTEKDLLKNAEKRAKEFDATNSGGASGSGIFGAEANSTAKDPSRMYIKEFKKVIEAADVIIQVLDARDPMRSRCPQVESAIISAGTSKRLVLLLNKVDLVPREVVEKWLKYLRNEFPTLAFKASTQNQKENLARSKISFASASDQLLQSAQCLGAEDLMKLLGNYSRSLDVKTAIRVGVVGFPNVGKSSVINSLKRAQACDTGSVPGMTKQMQEVKLDKKIKMIDSPGIVMSSSVDPVERVLRNCTRLDLAGVDASLVVEHILRRCTTQQIMLQYGVPNFKDTSEFLTLMAQKLGRLKKGGIPDVEKAAFKVVEDWNIGKIRYYTQPPEEHSLSHHLTAEIVTEMSSAFDLSQVDALQTLTLDKLKGPDAAKDLVLPSQGFTDGETDEDKLGQNKDDDDDECEWEDDDDDDDDEEEEKENEEMVDDLAAEESKLKKNADSLVVSGPSPSVSKKSSLRKAKGAEIAERLAEKKRQVKVRFASKAVGGVETPAPGRRGASASKTASSSSSSAAASSSSDRANEAMKKQFKKMKKERKRNEKVASGLADGMDKAFSSLGGSGGIGDDDYDFGVL